MLHNRKSNLRATLTTTRGRIVPSLEMSRGSRNDNNKTEIRGATTTTEDNPLPAKEEITIAIKMIIIRESSKVEDSKAIIVGGPRTAATTDATTTTIEEEEEEEEGVELRARSKIRELRLLLLWDRIRSVPASG